MVTKSFPSWKKRQSLPWQKLSSFMYCPQSTKYTWCSTWHSETRVNSPCQSHNRSTDTQSPSIDRQLIIYKVTRYLQDTIIFFQLLSISQKSSAKTITDLTYKDPQLRFTPINIRFHRTLNTFAHISSLPILALIRLYLLISPLHILTWVLESFILQVPLLSFQQRSSPKPTCEVQEPTLVTFTLTCPSSRFW